MHHVLTRTADKPVFDLTMKAYGQASINQPERRRPQCDFTVAALGDLMSGPKSHTWTRKESFSQQATDIDIDLTLSIDNILNGVSMEATRHKPAAALSMPLPS